ncbi:hypothetical protein C8F04DRAFT_85998 [Mycena alexandri]|uniref:Uncharacterized protein n=1 Tax=Mycena alexandri TaxID=1745969 RepID=A0AAD6TE67_9AGAR|nr:hypothetical protein C8F04DRAFT_85998 [Mycena alexandri]
MHQAHNIAWDSLTAHLIFISENPAVTPRRTGFFPRGLPTQAKSLNHFARTIATTVREFSDTERAKYPPRYDTPLRGQLFSDTILSRYSDLHFPSVTAQNQLIENWIERAGSPPSYSTSQGDLADVVKVLIAENQMDQLLMLAQHPRVPLIELHSLSWGHSFGWNHLMDWALEAYIFFSVLLSKPELHADGRYKLMTEYRWVCRKLTCSADYDAQTLPHREFFWGSLERAVGEEEFDPLGDSNKLHEYLKMCFRLLCRYDMLVRECGRTVDWEGCVARTVGYLWNTKVDYVYDEKGDYVYNEKGDTVIRFA